MHCCPVAPPRTDVELATAARKQAFLAALRSKRVHRYGRSGEGLRDLLGTAIFPPEIIVGPAKVDDDRLTASGLVNRGRFCIQDWILTGVKLGRADL